MRALITFTSLVLVLTVASAALPVNGEMEIYDNVVRLHVLANSDSEADQSLKLLVRDAVLEDMREYMSLSVDAEESRQIVEANIERIEETARKCIQENGCDYEVEVLCGYEEYPRREYDSVTLPAGVYYSVRVKIGKGEGKNWWCVLFPPLCLKAAEAKTDDGLVKAGLTPEQVDIITENDSKEYVIKFKFLEFFKSAFKKR